ncbi:hypothetical protein GQ44DRAFT_778516 [Phaeosphaeriaceae sp. PMI808]|nr:hypothetical protein GQ44DRAFT_778516 [Phaeosphaeriaceae sp. PMI808]
MRNSAEPWKNNPWDGDWDRSPEMTEPEQFDPVKELLEMLERKDDMEPLFISTADGEKVALTHDDSLLMKFLSGWVPAVELLANMEQDEDEKEQNSESESGRFQYPVPGAYVDTIPVHLARMHKYRRFATTETKSMALVPVSAQVGDLICALDYCPSSIILRPVEGTSAPVKYKIIGLCYSPDVAYQSARAKLQNVIYLYR